MTYRQDNFAQFVPTRGRLRVLVGMEYSGRVRNAFRALGHDAWSCDLLPAEDNSPFHIQGNVFDYLRDGWDIGIFHPTCTYLTTAAEWAYGDGPYHQKVRPETLVGAARREAREAAIADVLRLWDAPIPHRVIENPRGVLSTRWSPPTQTIQPFEFGEDASKATCLWHTLPLLKPTNRVRGRMVEWPRGSGRMVERWGNQTDSGQNRLTPGEDRWKERSRTYQGIANAFAAQWGGPITVKEAA
jgi:hypothetical protein